jgi:transposase
MHGFALNARERRQLREKLAQCRDARLYRRVFALLEVDAGRSVAQVARGLGVTRQSLHNWLRAYRELPRWESLYDGPRSGRPSVLDERLREELRVLMDQSPRELGYLANTWTVPLLREHLRDVHGKECAARTVRRELHALGYTWKRPRYTLAPDPEREKKTENSPFSAEIGAAQRHPGRG